MSTPARNCSLCVSLAGRVRDKEEHELQEGDFQEFERFHDQNNSEYRYRNCERISLALLIMSCMYCAQAAMLTYVQSRTH